LILKNILSSGKGTRKKVAELAGDCRESQNCGSQILKVCNRSSATFFSPQFRNRFGCPQYCGIAEVRPKIADAQLCNQMPLV
jgi:hypothetical protein